MDLVAALSSALVCASALLIGERVQRRFFVPYLESNPKEPRQPPLVRMGLGLDEMTFGPWDFVPAWRVLNRPMPPDLEQRQRAARRAFLLMPVLALGGPILLTLSPAIGIGWFAGFIIGIALRGWGSAISVSRDTAADGLDRTSRIALQITTALPFLVLVAAMLLVIGYRAK